MTGPLEFSVDVLGKCFLLPCNTWEVLHMFLPKSSRVSLGCLIFLILSYIFPTVLDQSALVLKSLLEEVGYPK